MLLQCVTSNNNCTYRQNQKVEIQYCDFLWEMNQFPVTFTKNGATPVTGVTKFYVWLKNLTHLQDRKQLNGSLILKTILRKKVTLLTQCRNFLISLSLSIYVKSILGILCISSKSAIFSTLWIFAHFEG